MTKENKQFDELTPDELKDIKIEFAPGCFDSFEGTQEELDEFIATITEMFRSGEAQKKARRIDFDSPEDLDDTDIEMLEKIFQQEENAKGRKLQ